MGQPPGLGQRTAFGERIRRSFRFCSINPYPQNPPEPGLFRRPKIGGDSLRGKGLEQGMEPGTNILCKLPPAPPRRLRVHRLRRFNPHDRHRERQSVGATVEVVSPLVDVADGPNRQRGTSDIHTAPLECGACHRHPACYAPR
jgi:hypothetical protein